ncbi:MAG: hypothetical protein Q8N61_01250 [bacterium]|nr:hypothetical protein [bacterium]
MIKNSLLKIENIILKNSLQNKIVSFNEIIKPGFNFGTVTKKDNPKEYFASSILNKIYSLNVSMENSLFTNDVFLSIYLFRYIYELYIKVFYIFSGSSEEQILFRLNEFFDNKKWNIKDIKDDINDSFLPPKFKEDHEEKYKKICRFVHPNHDSFKLHLNRTDDQQFEFLIPNINLTIWHMIEIIRLFSNEKILDFDKKIDQERLVSLQRV